MTKKPSVVSVGTKDSSAALPRWSQKGRDSRSMMGHDSILTQRLGSPVSKSKACSSSSSHMMPAWRDPAQRSTAQHSAVQPSPAQLSPAQPSPAQPSPAQPSPAQPSPAQPSPTRSYSHSTAQHRSHSQSTGNKQEIKSSRVMTNASDSSCTDRCLSYFM